MGRGPPARTSLVRQMSTLRIVRRCSTAAWLGLVAGLVLAACATTLRAQSSGLAVGATAASSTWDDGRREQALATVVQLAPAPWLVLGATPTVLRAQGTDGAAARVGFADLPVFAGITHAIALPLRPTLAVAGVASLPTGDTAQGLGRGTTLVSAEGTLALSPLRALTLRGGGARLVRDGGLLPAGAPRTTLFGDAVVSLGGRANASAGWAAEVDAAHDAPWPPARTVNAALVQAIAGSTSLVVSGARTLRGTGPTWSVAIGIGSAFGGVSPVGASSVRGRAPAGTSPTGGQSLLPIGRSAPGCGLLGGC